MIVRERRWAQPAPQDRPTIVQQRSTVGLNGHVRKTLLRLPPYGFEAGRRERREGPRSRAGNATGPRYAAPQDSAVTHHGLGGRMLLPR